MFVPVSRRRMRAQGTAVIHDESPGGVSRQRCRDGYRSQRRGRQHSAQTSELHEETGLVITAAHAPRLVWVQTVAFSSTQEHGYAELGWNVRWWHQSWRQRPTRM
jgi:hypothetical protein